MRKHEDAMVQQKQQSIQHGDTESPLEIGRYIDTYAMQRHYTCGHLVCDAFQFNNRDQCPRCTGQQKVIEKQEMADQALKDQLHRCHKAFAFQWSGQEVFHANELWKRVQANFSQLELIESLESLSNLPGFVDFLKQKVRVRCLDHRHNNELPEGIPNKQQDQVMGGFCPERVTWSRDQILQCPSDRSIGLVIFQNNDYAGIDAIPLSHEAVVDISMKETAAMQSGPRGARAGAATGHFVPYDDPSTAEKSRSMSTATHLDNLLLSGNGYGTALKLQYMGGPKGRSRKKYNSCYKDAWIVRNSAAMKRKLAMKDKYLRKKLIEEMKSRLLSSWY
jgi:hypothetical protein